MLSSIPGIACCHNEMVFVVYTVLLSIPGIPCCHNEKVCCRRIVGRVVISGEQQIPAVLSGKMSTGGRSRDRLLVLPDRLVSPRQRGVQTTCAAAEV